MPTRAPVLRPHPRKPKTRGPIHNGLRYDTAPWRTLRAQVLQEEPLCRCEEHKDATQPFGAKPDAPASEVVDHIQAHKGNAELFFQRTNLRGMSRRCHNRKTNRVDGGFGNPQHVSA